jgi:hypothetical protein
MEAMIVGCTGDYTTIDEANGNTSGKTIQI